MAVIVLLGVASAANLIVNAKTFLLCCSGHFTCCVIVGLFCLCLTVSAVFIALIYAPIVFLIAVAVCLVCCSGLGSSSDDG